MAVDPEHIRSALRRLVSGVTVVTTTQGGPANGTQPGLRGGAVHGMTANSFTSVSLDPPLVLVSVARQAKMDRWIAETGRYGVSVLSGAQKPLSAHFAGGPQLRQEVRFEWRDGLPLLTGALVQLTCSVRASHPAGDHTLHIGELSGLWWRDGDPLVFYGGRLRTLDVVEQAHSPAGSS